MRKVVAFILTGALLLSLAACKKEDPVQANPEGSQTQEEPPVPEEEIELSPITDVTIPADMVEGRIPVDRYVLPEQITDMSLWDGQTVLLAQEEDASFYALEGKESNPVLLRWGEHQGEFDWIYATPRAIAPQLWMFDADGDGETELVVNCYGGSGTGVSLEYIHVVEKEAGGTLVSYDLPWEDLCRQVDPQLQAVPVGDGLSAALGTELVDITESIPAHEKVEKLCLGGIASYTPTEQGLECTFSVMALGKTLPFATVYVAEVQGVLSYENGTYQLENMHLVDF